jgi:hypothetical protein
MCKVVLPPLKTGGLEMRKAQLEDMFKNGTAIRRKDVEQECLCYPNQIYRVDDWAVLVVFRSMSGPDFPLSERGLMRIRESYNNRKVVNAYVVLAERGEEKQPVYIANETLGNVIKKIGHAEALELRQEFGPCWFINKDFELVKRMQHDDYEM